MPTYQLRWDERLGHRANLRRLFGDPSSPLLDEGEFVLASELPEGAGCFRILRAIAAGERTYGGIERLAAIDIERQLDRLTSLGLVERVTPVTEDPAREAGRLPDRRQRPHVLVPVRVPPPGRRRPRAGEARGRRRDPPGPLRPHGRTVGGDGAGPRPAPRRPRRAARRADRGRALVGRGRRCRDRPRRPPRAYGGARRLGEVGATGRAAGARAAAARRGGAPSAGRRPRPPHWSRGGSWRGWGRGSRSRSPPGTSARTWRRERRDASGLDASRGPPRPPPRTPPARR
jgi:hypothetical protein